MVTVRLPQCKCFFFLRCKRRDSFSCLLSLFLEHKWLDLIWRRDDVTLRHIRDSSLTETPLSLTIFCDSHWFQKLETTRERTDMLRLRMNSDWFQSALNPKSWLNTHPLWLPSSKWCLVALVKSQQLVKKEKENEKDAMHFQKDALYWKQYS